MVYALAGLMVSNIRYFSLWAIDIHRRQPFWVLVAVILVLKLLIAEPQLCLFRGLLPLCAVRSGALGLRSRAAVAAAFPSDAGT